MDSTHRMDSELTRLTVDASKSTTGPGSNTVTQHRLRLTLTTTRSTTAADGQDSRSIVSIPSGPTSTADTSQIINGAQAGLSSSNLVTPNLRLNRSKAKEGKKRKPEDNPPSASSKKQKTADTLGIPTDGNAVRYVSCYFGLLC